MNRREFLKLSAGSALVLALPINFAIKSELSQEVIQFAQKWGETALSYGFSTQELILSYLVMAGMWSVDALAALLMLITTLSIIVVSALLI
tara:strand:+ start:395 stop:667 length:273 start_codon:yes stop_codon:yes gene_type:complete